MKLLELKLSDEELDTIEDLAAVNYSPEKIALYIHTDKKAFLQHYYHKNSQVRLRYDRGQLQSEFLINQKQLELARAGNITAAQIFLKEADKVNTANILKNVLFGHEH